MPGDNRMPLIIWATRAEYGELISALGADDSFHEVLRRVVLAHQERLATVTFTLTQDDAERITESLDITDFAEITDLIEQMREQLDWLRRNRTITAKRFALPNVGTFFGD
jgi:hypothetical protein